MKKKILFLFLGVLCIFCGCVYLTDSKPILKQSDYEKMIAGRFDAEYIGTNNCLFKCHEHDKVSEYFKKSVHAEQINKETMLPLVNCETCHGPGSLAVDNIKEVNGRKQCDYETLINLKKLPAGAKNLTCLKCHTVYSTPNMAFWRGSMHELQNVSCSDCHKLHKSPIQKVGHDEEVKMCIGCHKKVKGEVLNVSHHPLLENKVVCTDCHNPHGTIGEKMLRYPMVREVCARCHMEKAAPRAFRHGDLMDDCTNCHNPHGAINDNLLKSREPVLCLKCHKGHTVAGVNAGKKLYTRCTDCHGTIHGTDLPSSVGTPNGLMR